MEYKQIIKDGKSMMYKVKFIETSRITAKIDKMNQILVTCPKHVSFDMIDEFVLKYFDKFYNFFEYKKENSLIDISNNKISLNGIGYEIRTIISDKKREKYQIINRKIYLHLKSEENKLKMIKKILNELGKDFLIKRCWMLANKHNFTQLEKVSTRWYETKWGQCLFNEKEIVLTSQLYMMNNELIDYVIIHELCHLIHPNHSKEFWNALENLYPNYKFAKNKLKYEF